MKTARYYIEFDMLENEMSTSMEITKAAYTEQIHHLRKQATATAKLECPVEELCTRTIDRGNITVTIIRFICGCATTTLTKHECKPGYHFKAKK